MPAPRGPAALPCLRRLRRVRQDLGRQLGTAVGDGFATWSRVLGQLGLSATAPATGLHHADDALTWHRVEVDGRVVVYGAGGSGPPVLFLHGWGLGSRAYKRALRRLTARGCRVYAPAMPGFGGSAAMPVPLMSIASYGDWAARFLDEVGVHEPALVIGHSFGGGVGTALAHAHPGRVRYLVLLNAVGGATWDGRAGGSLADRPLWDWARGFARDLVGPEGIETLGAISQDVVTNLVVNPVVLARAGWLAKDADLTAELVGVRAAGTPVLALTSEGDQVIPDAAFASLCDSVGAEGRVVRGGHSWVLADPDHFAQVLQNVVDVEVADHRATSAEAVADQVRALLVGTAIPRAVADALVAEAPPLWLVSDAPGSLAADLALCHPPLRPGEVRAVALPVDPGPAVVDDALDGRGPLTAEERRSGAGTALRLTVVAADRPGLLADTTAVLAEAGLSVSSASAMTWPARDGAPALAVHGLVVDPGSVLAEGDFGDLGRRLRLAAAGFAPEPDFHPLGPAHVEVSGDPAHRATVTVTARDQLGLLWATCRWFADHDVTIETVHATTSAGVARDGFVVLGACDPGALAERLSVRRRGRIPA